MDMSDATNEVSAEIRVSLMNDIIQGFFIFKKKGGEVQKNLGPEHPESII